MDITYDQSASGGMATISRWHVTVGDRTKLGDPIAEIETDKVEYDLESPASGTITEILVDAGDEVAPGEVLARLQEDEVQ